VLVLAPFVIPAKACPRENGGGNPYLMQYIAPAFAGVTVGVAFVGVIVEDKGLPLYKLAPARVIFANAVAGGDNERYF